MKKITLITLLLISQILFSQEKSSELSNVEFTKAVESYKQLVMTKVFMDSQETAQKLAFGRAVPSSEDILVSDEKYLSWIKENLHKSTFKTIEEPVKLRKKFIELQEKLRIENKELYDLIERGTPEQRLVILSPGMYQRD